MRGEVTDYLATSSDSTMGHKEQLLLQEMQDILLAMNLIPPQKYANN